jgi:hypothetical protein
MAPAGANGIAKGAKNFDHKTTRSTPRGSKFPSPVISGRDLSRPRREREKCIHEKRGDHAAQGH